MENFTIIAGIIATIAYMIWDYIESDAKMRSNRR